MRTCLTSFVLSLQIKSAVATDPQTTSKYFDSASFCRTASGLGGWRVDEPLPPPEAAEEFCETIWQERGEGAQGRGDSVYDGDEDDRV